MYVISEKATGYDWHLRKIPTLRHATGCEKFLKVKEFVKKSEKLKSMENFGNDSSDG